MDATRVSDSTVVYIKRVDTLSEELRIALMLGTGDLQQDPKNHCVPVLEHFEDDEDSSISYMVMPYLYSLDKPPVERVKHVIGLVDQVLEVR